MFSLIRNAFLLCKNMWFCNEAGKNNKLIVKR